MASLSPLRKTGHGRVCRIQHSELHSAHTGPHWARLFSQGPISGANMGSSSGPMHWSHCAALKMEKSPGLEMGRGLTVVQMSVETTETLQQWGVQASVQRGLQTSDRISRLAAVTSSVWKSCRTRRNRSGRKTHSHGRGNAAMHNFKLKFSRPAGHRGGMQVCIKYPEKSGAAGAGRGSDGTGVARCCEAALALMHDRTGFRELLRMTTEEFDFLLGKVEHLITKQNTKMRLAVSPRERLSLTLRCLATGKTFKSLRFQYRIGTSTISKMAMETCAALYQTMKKD
ncbi:hypothetical protein N1851_003514 [Merluccius polli]|uniref:Uncharacterized protein n=1 Tax=Merluccius polli TaxID=89951 RepID=A0AA47N9J9_MERPO|nr:hypothetical protein N1851_003514 [Merluccius polli]